MLLLLAKLYIIYSILIIFYSFIITFVFQIHYVFSSRIYIRFLSESIEFSVWEEYWDPGHALCLIPRDHFDLKEAFTCWWTFCYLFCWRDQEIPKYDIGEDTPEKVDSNSICKIISSAIPSNAFTINLKNFVN